MAKQIIWSLRAHQDRKEILQYWRLKNQSATYSKKLNELFKKAVEIFVKHPQIGRKTDIKNIRVKLVRDYLIILLILTIWDNRRNPEELKIR
jgi:plasmid stabilization system protein ParE